MVRCAPSRSRIRHCQLMLIIAIALSIGMAPVSMVAQTSQAQGPGMPLDLAAMTLRPSDLDAAGLPNYGVSLAIMGDAMNAGGFLAAWRGDPNGETASGLFRADPLRVHLSYVSLSEVIGDNTADTARQVLSYIVEFASAGAAQAGFPILADAWSISGTSEVPGGEGIGDERVVVSLRGQQPGSSAFYDRVDLLFRSGALIAGVSVENFTGDPPTVEETERLARRLLERIDEIRAGGGPGLGSRAVRFTIPAWAQSWDTDAYNVIDGEGLRQFGESDASLAEYQARVDADQMTDYYLVAQPLNRLTDGAYGTYLNLVRLFETPEAASAFLHDANNRLERNGYLDLTSVDTAPAYGDESIAVTYRRQIGGRAIQGYRITMRLGTTIASVDLSGVESPPAELVESLMTTQQMCLTSPTCPMSLPLPEEFG